MYIPMRGSVTLLLVREFGGRAVPLARVNNPGLVQSVRDAVVRDKLAEAQQSRDAFLARRLEREAAEIEEA
jgi:hypothetical protein